MVLNQTERFIRGQFLLACVFFTPLVITMGRSVLYSRLTKIAEVQNYSIDDKRDILNTFDTTDQNNKGFPIDPFDLMHRINQAGAMNNATTPSDALDEALNSFEELEY